MQVPMAPEGNWEMKSPRKAKAYFLLHVAPSRFGAGRWDSISMGVSDSIWVAQKDKKQLRSWGPVKNEKLLETLFNLSEEEKRQTGNN